MKRPDGILLKHTDPMYRIACMVMAHRVDSMNSITIDIPLAPIDSYLRQKKKEGRPVSHMAVIMAAYLQTMAQFPALNRFIVNKRAYARNEIAVGMVVLGAAVSEDDSNEGTMSKMFFEPNETVFTAEEKIQEYIQRNRGDVKDNKTEKLIATLMSLPGLIRGAVAFLKWLDKHNWLPKSIIDASPFHCSMVFTNLASIRTNHIYHHCYDFGTTGLVMAAGNSREVAKRKGGEIVFEKCMPMGVVMDERICSGSYFGTAFRYMRHLLANPELLETPPEVIKTDPAL